MTTRQPNEFNGVIYEDAAVADAIQANLHDAAELKASRLALGLAVTDCADMFDVPVRTWQRMERAERSIGDGIWNRMDSLLDQRAAIVEAAGKSDVFVLKRHSKLTDWNVRIYNAAVTFAYQCAIDRGVDAVIRYDDMEPNDNMVFPALKRLDAESRMSEE